MLQTLTIHSFAIIDYAQIEFDNGMTVLSGETGAGKSIIIDALGILCGGRGSSDLIRKGEEKLIIEGLFQFDTYPQALSEILEHYAIESINLMEEGLIIRREITQNGKNTIRLNGQLINVSTLKHIGMYLVDIHGQNEHQVLFDSQFHLQLIDQLGDARFGELKQLYSQAYQNYRSLKQEWDTMQKNELEQLQKLSFLEFQIQEIEQANLVQEEYEQLQQLSQRLQNASKISEGIQSVNYLMSEDTQSVTAQLAHVIKHLSSLASIDQQYSSILERVQTAQYDLQECAQELAYSVDDFQEDQSIDEVETRLNELEQLKRKYGMEIDEILEHFQVISEEVYQIRHRETYLESLAQKLMQAYEQAHHLAGQLSQEREILAQRLVKAIEAELSELYMPNSKFQVEFTSNGTELIELSPDNKVEWYRLSESGYQTAEFLAVTNVGEDFKPLIKIASGGEISRFMLALKTVFSHQASERVMVFDEIDSGVSGRVAQAIAEKMKDISQQHQVLCITHLAQVAAIANAQLYIQKADDGHHTSTQVERLSPSQRIEVIAQMISGKSVTSASMKLASELMQDMQSYRRA